MTILTKTINILVEKNNCQPSIWIKWLNSLGGWEYELFFIRQDENYDIDSGNTILKYELDELQNRNEKEFSIGGTSRKIITCYKDGVFINNKQRWNDFKKQTTKNDCWLWNKNYTGQIFITDGSLIGSINGYSKNHGQETGDQVIIIGTINYDGTKQIVKIDDNNFYWIDTFVSQESGQFKRIVQDSDWLRCQVENVSPPIETHKSSFNIIFNLLLPSDGN